MDIPKIVDALVEYAYLYCALSHDPDVSPPSMSMREMSDALAANGAKMRELRDCICNRADDDESAMTDEGRMASIRGQLDRLQHGAKSARRQQQRQQQRSDCVMNMRIAQHLLDDARHILDAPLYELLLAYIARKTFAMTSMVAIDGVN